MLSFLSRFRSDRSDRDAAERIYAAAVVSARNPSLFRDLGVPDTMQGRFESISLHLFAVVHRLMHEPGDDPGLARILAESLVAHTDADYRELGVSDAGLSKRMKTLYQSFAGRLTAYKQGLEEGDHALAEAISRNVFPDGDPGNRAPLLAEYLKAAVNAIRGAELSDLRTGRLPFPALPLSAR